jgi:hypothetical protein
MAKTNLSEYVAFDGARLVAQGSRLEVALALQRANSAAGSLLAFELESGAQLDFDLSGGDVAIAARYGEAERSRGRPKLGVLAREVTLLPRHWDWLNGQRGGASAAIRRLVDTARAADQGGAETALAKAAAYRFLSAMAGNLPQFEEAARALFAGDIERLRGLTSAWPPDVVAVAFERLETGKSALSR